jgi:hypothetical protein
MVKTAINPAVEAATAARSASDRANRTNEIEEIEEAISEWEKVAQMINDGDILDNQAEILTSYADSLFMRWKLNHQLDDVRAIVANLERALEKLPHSAIQARHDLLIRLAAIHRSWYHNFKDEWQALIQAIRYGEQVYGLAVILRQMKEAV